MTLALLGSLVIWLALLAQGWRLPWIVDACDVGGWSVLLWRPA